MKISNLTLEVLKNFASINQNIVVRAGQPVKTIAQAKNVLAQFDAPEDFPVDFGIYDLNEFLAAVNLIEDAELEFTSKNVVVKNATSQISYTFSSPEILTTAPEKAVEMPSSDVVVTISESDLAQVRRVASVFGHTELAVVGDKNGAKLSVLDTTNATANTFETTLSDVKSDLDEYSFVVNIPNLKLISGDYEVTFSKALISLWEHSTYPVSYHVALDATSEA